MTWGTLALGVRIARHPEPLFVASWTRLLVDGLRPGDHVLEPAIGLRGTSAANELVRQFLRSDCDALALFDDDMTFPSTALTTIRDNPDGWPYDVLSALATRRTWPPVPVIMRLTEQPSGPEARRGEHYVNPADWQRGAVLDVDAVGLAFTLIRRELLEALREPGIPDELQYWFDPGVGDESDEIAFCRRARAMGARLGVDTALEIGHVASVTYTPETWRRYMRTVDI